MKLSPGDVVMNIFTHGYSLIVAVHGDTVEIRPMECETPVQEVNYAKLLPLRKVGWVSPGIVSLEKSLREEFEAASETRKKRCEFLSNVAWERGFDAPPEVVFRHMTTFNRWLGFHISNARLIELTGVKRHPGRTPA